MMKSDITFRFEQMGRTVEVFGVQPDCGRTFHVATIREPGNQNPLVELKGPLGMAAVAKMVAEFKGYVVLKPGLIAQAVAALAPFAECVRHPDPYNPPTSAFEKAAEAWEALMRVDCGGACGKFGIVEADCAVHDQRER